MNRLLFNCTCTVNELDQSDGTPLPVIVNLKATTPFPYIFRQTRANTAYDFQPMQVFTAVPSEEIKEHMRMVFDDGQDFRIHSVNKWPVVNPEFLEIVLHGDGA